MKEFFELEKIRTDKRISEEKDKANKKYKLM